MTGTARWLRVSKRADSAVKDKGKHQAARRAERAPGHAEAALPSVTVDTYNEELRDEDGFVGDRASGRAFRAILDDWRERVAQHGDDPLGDKDSRDISKSQLDKLLTSGDPVAAGLIHSTVEEFAHELATVVRRFLRLEKWRGTQRIVIGGGLSSSQIGRLAMGRAAVLLNAEGIAIELVLIEYHHDEAGLIGSLHFAPGWVFTGHDAILAADIGGTNLRVGVVKHQASKKSDLSKASVWRLEHWRHADDKASREEAIERIAKMMTSLIGQAVSEQVNLAPFVGIACPGLIDDKGVIVRGGQNLPGNWQQPDFNLPAEIAARLPKIDGETPLVVMHNDAVVQGLSEVPRMTDVDHWAVLTIGTGLGNARFTNHRRG
ncbi:MAG TPA: ROK family protein [Reyranella sp.]|nr:ROK family protein [Reyranella sp.]